ncbi:Uncharacterised protein [Mycobacteroides abscessus subsp. abscessus]|nr:Uncharacterised protein [Mycobacteroides abscessus subsp. abscessus]SHU89872.1 Uncharacterised protein [Mycobacteroides abscessus subsp. abscessus]SHW76498.1 Uncharacterised protein [Mycobacteroides abscessus subsp. abscessus]SHX61895.1 Uncharacterised protein [Mycobacteroides abscessus subsp. abscessus]SHX72623.1 Uncharacterised protein [Mycobacteroides abscessus subsp. abscessus]
MAIGAAIAPAPLPRIGIVPPSGSPFARGVDGWSPHRFASASGSAVAADVLWTAVLRPVKVVVS